MMIRFTFQMFNFRCLVKYSRNLRDNPGWDSWKNDISLVSSYQLTICVSCRQVEMHALNPMCRHTHIRTHPRAHTHTHTRVQQLLGGGLARSKIPIGKIRTPILTNNQSDGWRVVIRHGWPGLSIEHRQPLRGSLMEANIATTSKEPPQILDEDTVTKLNFAPPCQTRVGRDQRNSPLWPSFDWELETSVLITFYWI